jgi:hypothetical protein
MTYRQRLEAQHRAVLAELEEARRRDGEAPEARAERARLERLAAVLEEKRRKRQPPHSRDWAVGRVTAATGGRLKGQFEARFRNLPDEFLHYHVTYRPSTFGRTRAFVVYLDGRVQEQ